MVNWKDVDKNDDETIDSEACAHLLHCESTTIEELARSGRLPAVKFGKSWLFHRQQVIVAMKRRALEEAAERARPKVPLGVQVTRKRKHVPSWLVPPKKD